MLQGFQWTSTHISVFILIARRKYTVWKKVTANKTCTLTACSERTTICSQRTAGYIYFPAAKFISFHDLVSGSLVCLQLSSECIRRDDEVQLLLIENARLLEKVLIKVIHVNNLWAQFKQRNPYLRKIAYLFKYFWLTSLKHFFPLNKKCNFYRLWETFLETYRPGNENWRTSRWRSTFYYELSVESNMNGQTLQEKQGGGKLPVWDGH